MHSNIPALSSHLCRAPPSKVAQASRSSDCSHLFIHGQARPGPGPGPGSGAHPPPAGAPCTPHTHTHIHTHREREGERPNPHPLLPPPRTELSVGTYLHADSHSASNTGRSTPQQRKRACSFQSSLFLSLPCTRTHLPLPGSLPVVSLIDPALSLRVLELVGFSLVLFPLVSALLIPHPHQRQPVVDHFDLSFSGSRNNNKV